MTTTTAAARGFDGAVVIGGNARAGTSARDLDEAMATIGDDDRAWRGNRDLKDGTFGWGRQMTSTHTITRFTKSNFV
jgi:hypothetical protein